MKLSLGTVQLGVPYGVNNAGGMLSDAQAEAVLRAAHDSGFTMLDTSHEYGLALERIGRFLRAHPGAFEVVVKYNAADPPERLERLEARSRELLDGADHFTLYWTAGGTDIAALDPFGADGVTVYTVAEAEAVPGGFDMIQVPGSCLDGRMDAEIPRLQAKGKIVLVRSLLLQGLLAADPATGPAGHHNCPELAAAARPYLRGLQQLAVAHGMSVPELAVRWAWEIEPDVAVLGAETPGQVRTLADAWKRGPLPESVVRQVLDLRADVPEVVISPMLWRQAFAFTLGEPDAR